MRVKVSQLKPNPFRRLHEYPILSEKVQALEESIETTGFWANLLGRPCGDDIEIAYGHHRLVALQNVYGPDHEIEITVQAIGNDQMLKIMARENMAEWGSSAWVEIETVRATIDAYGRDLIKLPKVAAQTNVCLIRYARELSPEHKYTVMSVAQFLGWKITNKKTGKHEPNFACDVAFKAIDAMEEGLITPEDIRGMSRSQIDGLIEAQSSIRKREQDIAESNRRAAESARQKAEKEADAIAKQKLAKQADIHEQQAKQHESAAVQKPKDFAKTAAKIYDGEKGSIRKVREAAAAVMPDMEREVKVHHLDDHARRIVKRLNEVFADKANGLKGELKFLAENKNDLSDHMKGVISETLQEMIATINRLAKPFSEDDTRSHKMGQERPCLTKPNGRSN